jgi:hypothetical protein
MPKKTKNSRAKGGKGRIDGGSGSDDDGSMFNDNASVSSMAISESSTVQEDQAVDESSAEETFENKLKDAIELASEKSAITRTKGLEALCQGLIKRHAPEFLDNRKATICDLVERSLKKGKGGEVQAASKLALLLGVQLYQCEEVYKELRTTMLPLISDKTASPSSRAAVASALAGLCFLGGGEMAEVVTLMKILEGIYSLSAAKKDGSVPTVSPDSIVLHTSCLAGWALLSTLLSPGQIYDTVNSYVNVLQSMFTSADVDLRITAGETMVLLLESAYEYDEEFEPDSFDELVSNLKQLATDSSKSKSKKDRKEQRSSFRDVLRGVEEGESPNETIKFGKEVLNLDSWFIKCQYDYFCKMMGAGMNYHLSVNSVMRDVFQLGNPLIIDADGANKLSKTQRNAANQQAFKARTQVRSKHRDKRSAVV